MSKEKKKAALQTTVSTKVREDFDRIAEQEGRTSAGHLRFVIEKHVAEKNAEKKKESK